MTERLQELGAALFDSHAHLTFEDFGQELDDVLARARAAGVSGIVTVGSGGGAGAFRAALDLARRHDWIWATAGLHPHDARFATDALLEDIAAAVRSGAAVAVGEAGLDYHYGHSAPEDQRRAFRAQARMARELGAPLVVHTREADADTLEVLRDEGVGAAGGVVHCFSGGPAFAAEVLSLGLHVSFSGIVTFKNAGDVRDAVKVVPDGRLLIETDSPYLSPWPHRGRRNEPSRVGSVAGAIAEIRGLATDDVARITSANARALFGLRDDRAAPIVYTIRDQLYVNLTNCCSLSCVFCPKRRDWTVKGHQLRFEREPTDEEVRAALRGARPEAHREVVFCGLGEPTTRYDLVVSEAGALRGRGIRTRLDTDGLASLRVGRDVTGELAGAFDAVSVSLNAADGESYARLCPSPYGARAFEAVVEFLRSARTRFAEVTASVVAAPGLDIEAVRRLAEQDIGVRLRVRPYNVVG
jgi:TatD DNase family protein